MMPENLLMKRVFRRFFYPRQMTLLTGAEIAAIIQAQKQDNCLG